MSKKNIDKGDGITMSGPGAHWANEDSMSEQIQGSLRREEK